MRCPYCGGEVILKSNTRLMKPKAKPEAKVETRKKPSKGVKSGKPARLEAKK